MSLFIKCLVFLTVLGLAGFFVLKGPDGKPFLSPSDFIPNRNNINVNVEQILPEAVINNAETVYRWRDQNGVWQFSDTAPDNVSAEEIQVDTHSNSDIAPPAPKPLTVPPTPPASGQAIFIGENNEGKREVDTSMTPDNIKQLLEDANNVQSVMDERNTQIEKALQ